METLEQALQNRTPGFVSASRTLFALASRVRVKSLSPSPTLVAAVHAGQAASTAASATASAASTAAAACISVQFPLQLASVDVVEPVIRADYLAGLARSTSEHVDLIELGQKDEMQSTAIRELIDGLGTVRWSDLPAIIDSINAALVGYLKTARPMLFASATPSSIGLKESAFHCKAIRDAVNSTCWLVLRACSVARDPSKPDLRHVRRMTFELDGTLDTPSSIRLPISTPLDLLRTEIYGAVDAALCDIPPFLSGLGIFTPIIEIVATRGQHRPVSWAHATLRELFVAYFINVASDIVLSGKKTITNTTDYCQKIDAVSSVFASFRPDMQAALSEPLGDGSLERFLTHGPEFLSGCICFTMRYLDIMSRAVCDLYELADLDRRHDQFSVVQLFPFAGFYSQTELTSMRATHVRMCARLPSIPDMLGPHLASSTPLCSLPQFSTLLGIETSAHMHQTLSDAAPDASLMEQFNSAIRTGCSASNAISLAALPDFSLGQLWDIWCSTHSMLVSAEAAAASNPFFPDDLADIARVRPNVNTPAG